MTILTIKSLKKADDKKTFTARVMIEENIALEPKSKKIGTSAPVVDAFEYNTRTILTPNRN